MSKAGPIGIKAMTLALFLPARKVTSTAVERVWARARPDDPARVPGERGVRVRDAIAWAALSSAGVVASKFISRGAASAVYQTLTGNEPPPPAPSRTQKKAQKKADKVERKKLTSGQHLSGAAAKTGTSLTAR